jgi:XTP/dITP diphosphohydrolase
MRPDTVVMASSNAGKLVEITRILSALDIKVVPQSDFGVTDADETGDTFVENSLIKARHAAAATGLPAIADDSGLAVDALGGRPGVFSARYADPGATDQKNIDKLLTELRGVADDRRGAAFHCAASFVTTDGAVQLVAEGEWRGLILHRPQGVGGFGYDPIFFDSDLGRSAAELSTDVKNTRSHRGKALRALARQLAELKWT